MLDVAVGIAVVLLLLLLVSANENRRMLRMIERERNVSNAMIGQLLDRLMHMEGRTWTLPPTTPSDEVETIEEPEEPGWHSY